jgi:hypothetical protein
MLPDGGQSDFHYVDESTSECVLVKAWPHDGDCWAEWNTGHAGASESIHDNRLIGALSGNERQMMTVGLPVFDFRGLICLYPCAKRTCMAAGASAGWDLRRAI